MRAEKRPAAGTISSNNAPNPRQIPRAAKWAALALAVAVLAAGFAAWRFRPAAAVGSTRPALHAASDSDAKTFAAYAGSASCRDCHRAEFDLWAGSNHALAERNAGAREQTAFDPAREFHNGAETIQTRVLPTNGGFQIGAVSGTNFDHRRVERVIGNAPLRQFLVAADGGRWQAQQAAYDPTSNEWFDVFGSDGRQPGEWGHWTGRGMNWNSRCAECHNTRLRKNYDASADTYRTAMAEMSVGCEACHGPLKGHVEWRRAHPDSRVREPAPPAAAPPSLAIAVCGSCHSRRDDLTGDFKPGDSFFDHYSLVIPDRSGRWYADGQVKDEDYEFASFLGSRMHQSGVTCKDCHNPHSAKLVAAGNDLCMRCHQGNYVPFTNAPVINPSGHTHHASGSTGAQCTGCHMPVTVFMQRHPRHDHGLGIPDPLLTKELNIPNACNRCHKEQTADWALTYVGKWFGDKMNRHTRERARWIAAAERGDDSSSEHLLGMVAGNSEGFYWRAVAAGLLEQWADHPAVGSALGSLLRDENPLVREQAARALGRQLERGPAPAISASLEPLLRDPARNVRVAAAWALRSTLDLSSPAGAQLQEALALDADQPAGKYRQARLLFDRGQPEQALPALQKAIAWDPLSPPLRYEIATLLDQMGRPGEAEDQLRVACRLEPNSADACFKLALVLAETHRLDQAAQSLDQAVKLDPRHARAWYNLGLARSGLGDSPGALDALASAEALAPADPQIPYARATILARDGRAAEARAAARRALKVQPDFEPARRLLQTISDEK